MSLLEKYIVLLNGSLLDLFFVGLFIYLHCPQISLGMRSKQSRKETNFVKPTCLHDIHLFGITNALFEVPLYAQIT